MAQTTIHAPSNGYGRRGTATACGRAAGETTTDPATITCQSQACGNARSKHENQMAVAAITSGTFTAYLSPYLSDEEREAKMVTAATLAEGLGRPGIFDVRSEGLGLTVTVRSSEEADALYHMAENLMEAARRTRAIIEARAYATEYEAAKPATVQE